MKRIFAVVMVLAFVMGVNFLGCKKAEEAPVVDAPAVETPAEVPAEAPAVEK